MIKQKSTTIQGKDLIKELNLEGLPEEKQAKLVYEMANLVYDQILFRIADDLTEAEALELNKLLDSGEEQKIFEFLQKKVPDFVGLLREEIKKFEEKMIKNVRQEFLQA